MGICMGLSGGSGGPLRAGAASRTPPQTAGGERTLAAPDTGSRVQDPPPQTAGAERTLAAPDTGGTGHRQPSPDAVQTNRPAGTVRRLVHRNVHIYSETGQTVLSRFSD